MSRQLLHSSARGARLLFSRARGQAPGGARRAGTSARETYPSAAGAEPPGAAGKKNVVTERHGTIMTIGINRPEARNAVNQETAAMLLQAFNSFEDDTSLTVAVLHGIALASAKGEHTLLIIIVDINILNWSTKLEPFTVYDVSEMGTIFAFFQSPGIYPVFHDFSKMMAKGSSVSSLGILGCISSGTGGNFCAGYDLKELAHNPTSIKLEQDVTKGPGPMGPSRIKFSKPVIAAVSGYAVAGGLELSLLADLRVVEQSAVFGVFCRRFGVPLIDGGTVRLPRLIGLSRALDLILTGRPVSAQEAYEFGLANRIVPNGQALQCAMELAKQISAFPQKCMHGDRNSAYYSVFDATSFTEAMQFEFDTGVQVILKESVPGAKRFSLGEGRGGKL